MQYYMKNKHLWIYFIVGCLLTLPFILNPHYDFDTYQLFNIGYAEYARVFMLSGRVITALFYYVFSILQIPYSFLAIASVVCANLFMALSCVKFEQMLHKTRPIKGTNIMIYMMAIILLFFNFFMMEYFTFMETFIMSMAVYLFILSIQNFLNDTRGGYTKALAFAIAAMLCYQGAMSMYIPLLAFFVFLQNKDKEFKVLVSNFIKKGLYAVVIYGICYIIAFAIMKGYMIASGRVSLKDGEIDILANLATFRVMMSAAWKQLFGYFNPLYFYIAFILLIFANAWKAFTQKKAVIFLFLLIISTLCFLTPFIPNIFLPANANYVSPRVMVSVPMVIGLSALFYICAYPKENVFLRNFIFILLLIFNVLNLLNYHTMMNDGIAKHEQDKVMVGVIYSHIDAYEATSGSKITKIAYAQDASMKYNYDYKTINSFTYRLFAFPWAFEAAINGFSNNRKFDIEPISDEAKIELFGQYTDYDDFDEKQFVFDDSTLYLLLF